MKKLIAWIIDLIKGLLSYPTPPTDSSTSIPTTLHPSVINSTLPVETPIPQASPTVSVPPILPEYGKRSLLSRPETFFFYSLTRAIDNGYAVFAKVRMGDVLYLANEPTDEKQHKNNILCKHFDFVLCERQYYKPLLVIELDDKSHQWPDSIERDKLKDSICKMAICRYCALSGRVDRQPPKRFAISLMRNYRLYDLLHLLPLRTTPLLISSPYASASPSLCQRECGFRYFYNYITNVLLSCSFFL